MNITTKFNRGQWVWFATDYGLQFAAIIKISIIVIKNHPEITYDLGRGGDDMEEKYLFESKEAFIEHIQNTL